ncbi:hypothetical protein B0H13DRAFT_1914909 [Mycena leptocephala]|nr:hypothetical protein B0H13DRAFT_1914909 [Mycena leptocephala]
MKEKEEQEDAKCVQEGTRARRPRGVEAGKVLVPELPCARRGQEHAERARYRQEASGPPPRMIARGDWQERQTEEENDAKHLHEDARASVHDPVILGRQSQDPRAVVAAACMPHDGWCCSETEGKMPVGQPLPFGQMQIEIHIGYVSGAHPAGKPPRALDSARMREAPAGGAEGEDGTKGLNEEVGDATRTEWVPLPDLPKRPPCTQRKGQKGKEDLTQHLKKKESIPETDEAWLDNEANHVVEDTVIDSLENTSYYKHGLADLDLKQKGLVEKLKNLKEEGNMLKLQKYY